MAKEIKCEHYEGDGYLYELSGSNLLLCEKCEQKLRESMLEQIKNENKLR